jgi:hypothetical protein
MPLLIVHAVKPLRSRPPACRYRPITLNGRNRTRKTVPSLQPSLPMVICTLQWAQLLPPCFEFYRCDLVGVPNSRHYVTHAETPEHILSNSEKRASMCRRIILCSRGYSLRVYQNLEIPFKLTLSVLAGGPVRPACAGGLTL